MSGCQPSYVGSYTLRLHPQNDYLTASEFIAIGGDGIDAVAAGGAGAGDAEEGLEFCSCPPVDAGGGGFQIRTVFRTDDAAEFVAGDACAVG